jgi:hypothetical protein
MTNSIVSKLTQRPMQSAGAKKDRLAEFQLQGITSSMISSTVARLEGNYSGGLIVLQKEAVRPTDDALERRPISFVTNFANIYDEATFTTVSTKKALHRLSSVQAHSLCLKPHMLPSQIRDLEAAVTPQGG